MTIATALPFTANLTFAATADYSPTPWVYATTTNPLLVAPQPVDLTGYTAVAIIYGDTRDSTPLLTITTTASANGGIVLGNTAGTVAITLTHVATLNLPNVPLRWTLRLVSPAGVQTPLIVGGITRLAVGPLPPPPPILLTITVAPASPTIAFPGTQQFAATGHYNDSSTLDLTSIVTWASSLTSVATVSVGGLATMVLHGSTSISASFGLISGAAALTVTRTLISIAVTPGNQAIALLATEQFTATGTYSDSTTANITGSVNWTTSDATIATVAVGGLATSAGPTGGCTITATDPVTNVFGTTSLFTGIGAFIPSSPLVTFNALLPGTMSLSSAPVVVGGFVDAWNTAVQATLVNQANYDDRALASGPCVWFGAYARPDMVTPILVQALVAPSVAVTIPCTWAWFGATNNSTGNSTVPIFELGNVGTGVGCKVDALGSITIHGPSGSMTATCTWTLDDNCPHDLYVWTDLGGTTIFAELDGAAVTLTPTGTAPGAGPITGNLTIGTDHQIVDTATQIGPLGFLGVWNRILTLSERNGLRAYYKAGWYRSNPLATPAFNFVDLGDSIQRGDQTCAANAGVNRQFAHIQRVRDMVGPLLTINNVSVGGARLTLDDSVPSALTQWNTTGKAAVVPGMDNVISLYCGINDITAVAPIPDGPTAITDATTINGYMAAVVSAIATYMSGISHGAHGHTIVIETIGAWQVGFYDTCRGLVNANTLATYDGIPQSGIATACVQMGEDGLLGNVNGLWFLGDNSHGHPSFPGIISGPHPAQLGHDRQAGFDIAKLRALGILPATLTSITVTPASSNFGQGATEQFAAVGNYSDAPSIDITASVTWDATNHAIATVAAGGLATGVAAGSTTVTATSGLIVGSTPVTINPLAPPQTVSGLLRWFKAISADITLQAGVAQWNDKSGVGGGNATQPTNSTTKQPAFTATGGPGTGRGFVTFTDDSAQILKGTFVRAAPFSYFILMRATGAANANNYAIDFGGNTDAINLTSGGTAVANSTTLAHTTITTAAWHIIYCTMPASTAGTITIDGGSPVTGTTPGATAAALEIGSYGGDISANALGGDIAEIIVYDHALTSGDLATIVAYLQA
jgi:hypothetical protein